ncbi:acyltransferase [Devosia sp.]|uniref:acyltransferase family protein n=1 Tax=Devosia sp. TaxID=1871048 RepID=UPI003264EA46
MPNPFSAPAAAPPEPKRLHSLDAARGVAALAVVFWHWQHVYAIGGGELKDRTIQPFYGLLFPLYNAGWLAVEFFFTLSGFVFFWLYGQAIADKTLGLRSFWVARFSRLYPLHLLTLLIIAVLQIALMSHGLKSYIYGGTNVPNFLWNLFFLQYFVHGWTYNGPEWSVGVEIILYALFFLYCRLLKPHWILPLLIAVGIGVYVLFHDWATGRGIIGFFAGGLVYQAWRWWRAQPRLATWVTPLFWLTVALWAFSIFELKFHPVANWLNQFDGRGWWWMEMAFRMVLVPLSVLALALHDERGARFWQKVSPLGDLTYALYLWHFPLQLLMAVAVLLLGFPLAPIQTPWGLLVYLSALIGLSILSYNWVERPAQSWLRKRLSAPQRLPG